MQASRLDLNFTAKLHLFDKCVFFNLGFVSRQCGAQKKGRYTYWHCVAIAFVCRILLEHYLENSNACCLCVEHCLLRS